MSRHSRYLDDQELEDLQRRLPWSPEPVLKWPRGRLDPPYMTHVEIAAALGISQQAVSMAEKRALAKCRAWCERRGLSLSDLLGG